MADLYRKSSLEKLSNPEQLDRMIRISSPMSWLALAAVLLVIVATAIWACLGTLPTTETVNGILTGPANVCAVYADAAGTVSSFEKAPGDAVEEGEVLAKLTGPDGSAREVRAAMAGTVGALSAAPGDAVTTGTELMRLTPADAGAQVAVCYVPLTAAQKLRPGMAVQVCPAAVDSQKYGYLEAEILSVDAYAANTATLGYVLGTGNLVAEQFAANGPVVAVVCKLRTDGGSKSGLYWSNESGRALTVRNGSIVTARIVVESNPPITKLIDRLKSGMEG